MRCVILGGGGFLGRHVGKVMATAGYELWCVDMCPPHGPESTPWFKGHVQADYWDVDHWWAECGEPECVVHLASSTVPATASTDPVSDVNQNLIGLLKLLEGLGRQPSAPRLLYASSGGAVYGIPQSVPIDEDHPLIPIGAYGITKVACEHHIRLAETQYGLQTRILRISNPYGEWQRPNGVQGVISVFAHRALMGLPVDVWGDGSVVRDFVYAGDVAQAFVTAAHHQGSARVFNLGGGGGHSVNHIIKTLEQLLGRHVERKTHAARSFDPPINVLDIRRAQEELSWTPRVAFEQGVAKTLEWLRVAVK